MASPEIVARARGLIGARFRPQGRAAELGLDCIGVAAMAMGVPLERVRADYRLRSADAGEVNGELEGAGLIRIPAGSAGAGDLLVVVPGPGQLHVLILTPDGYIHADMRLRRVVGVPGPVPWEVASAWRHPQHEQPPGLAAGAKGQD